MEAKHTPETIAAVAEILKDHGALFVTHEYDMKALGDSLKNIIAKHYSPPVIINTDKAARQIVLKIWPTEDPGNAENAKWIEQKTATIVAIINQHKTPQEKAAPAQQARIDRLVRLLSFKEAERAELEVELERAATLLSEWSQAYKACVALAKVQP